MKKILSITTLLLTTLMVVGCKQELVKPLSFATADEALAFQAVTSVQMFEADELDLIVQTSEVETDEPTDTPDTDVPVEDQTEDVPVDEVEAIREISPYLQLFENLLESKNALTNEIMASDIEGYEFKHIFTVPNATGTLDMYMMYYNITDLESDDVDEDYDHDDEDRDDGDNEDYDHDDEDDDDIEADGQDEQASNAVVNKLDTLESEYVFSGILIYNDTTYEVKGKLETEADETELEFITYLDDLSYVVVKFEVESDEIEFEYEVYINGELESTFKIEFEFESDEMEIELEFEQGYNFGKYEFKLETKDSQNVLKIEFETNIDDVFTKGEAYYLVTMNSENQIQYEIILDK